jgi:predicted acyltransferase
MYHSEWTGFDFYDLIFPLFMFISGAAIPFSLVSKLEHHVPKSKLVLKVLKRALVLVLLGFIYNGVLNTGFRNPRFPSVLGQIGLAYLFAALIVVYSKSFRSWIYWLAGILVGYGLLQVYFPVPGIGTGVLTPEGCINSYVDRMILPGKLAGDVYDPEGLLNIVSAVGVTLMGVVAGYFLRDKYMTDYQKIKALLILGVSSILVAFFVNPYYPIIKKCWTTPFNLMTGGISFILMATFYWIVDVRGWRKWSFFFRIIGMNSIFIYLLYDLTDVFHTTDYLFGWTDCFGDIGLIIKISGSIILVWMLLFYMYKKNIFIRI